MFEDFSRGYYLGRIFVEPTDGEKPALQEEQYRKIKKALYQDSGETSIRSGTDKPLVFKINNSHLKVEGDHEIPSKTLGIPRKVLDGIRIDNPPTLKEVLLAKPKHASNILSLSKYED
ncbi:MAG: DUF5802 family protein [Halobacteria archaeon]